MKTPTDPLPEPWEWHNYRGDCWGVATLPDEDGRRNYLVWTFSPHKEGFDGYDIPGGTDCWVVRNHMPEVAKFPTFEEATHYMAMRAMLGTWPEKEEKE